MRISWLYLSNYDGTLSKWESLSLCYYEQLANDSRLSRSTYSSNSKNLEIDRLQSAFINFHFTSKRWARLVLG